ncbi:WD40-repeat-containing domain protein [Peziza echinospora]|nr:WD40-repeat-containing domain protein [Peziza echinospora]
MQPQQQQRNRSLSLAAGRFSFSTSHNMRPKSSGGFDAVPEDGNRRHNLAFCSLPIRRTGESVRKLIRRASQSFKLHPNNGGKLSMQLTPGVDKKFGGDASQASSLRSKSKGKSAVTGDSESGFFQDVDDCFYASDTLAVRRDFVKTLPSELTTHIFSYLDHKSLINCERVSHLWQNVAKSPHVWRETFKAQHGPWKSKPGNDWKRMFQVRQELDHRWKQGQVTAKYLRGHTDSVYCVQFDDQKIITGSRDQTIKIWDVHTGACIKTLGFGQQEKASEASGSCSDIAGQRRSSATEYHKASVLCLQFDDEILVSGSSDFSCIVWSLPSYTPIRRLKYHSAGVLDVCFDKKHIVSCSKDTTICVWDRKTGNLLRQLTGHCGPVNAVAIRGNLIVSASGDALIKLWNVDTGKCIRDFVGHNRGLACVQFSEDARTIVSGGNDQDIRIWDALSGDCLRVLSGHDQLVRTLHLDSQNKRIISGSYDMSVKVWDSEEGKLILDIQRFHASWVLSAKADFRRIVSTSQDNRTLVLDFSSGLRDLHLLE